jgi:ribosome-associated protein
LTAARAAASKQAHDIVVMDVRDLIGITDFFVVAAGSTDRQVRTIAEEVQRALRDGGVKPVRREGQREGRWVLLDFVDFVVHVFHDEEREYYGLERLWADAAVVPWDDRAASSG